MKKIILILFILLSGCTRIQFPDPLNIHNLSSFIYIKDDTHYFFKKEEIVSLVTYFNQSEPTTYKQLVESLERFEIETSEKTLYLTLFKEKDGYFIQNKDETYLLANTFYPKLLEYVKTAEAYKLNTEEKEVVQINGKLYYKTEKHPEFLPTCGTYDGKIESVISNTYLPNKENEANFNCLNVPYMYYLEDTYMILIDGEWFILQCFA